MNPLKALAHLVGQRYLREYLRRVYQNRVHFYVNERPIEYAFALRSLSHNPVKTVLDIGCGTTAWPALLSDCGYLVTAIDEMRTYHGEKVLNWHHHVIQDDITGSRLREQFDAVTCISTLEHIPDHDAAMREMLRLLRPGGVLVLTLPYNEKHSVENVYAHPLAGYGKKLRYICRVTSRSEVTGWLERHGGRIESQEYYRVFDGDYWTFGSRIQPPHQVSKDELHQLSCLSIKKLET